MVFSSPVFLFLFLPLCLWCYWLCPARGKNLVLLVFSLAFYAWGEAFYSLVMLLSILGNHWATGWMLAGANAAQIRRRLGIAIAANLLALGIFKYSGWAVQGAAGLLSSVGLEAPASWQSFTPHLPIGISFFTFQSISYLLDVARGTAAPQRRWTDFALYVALFPQLIAGPIVRYGDVARQLVARRHSWPLFASGVQRFALGLSKKVLIANSLAGPADEVFRLAGSDLSPGAAWLGAICYSLQIYFDFSGYSDMAIGLGRMFGFRFRENFLHPYGSRSITEFWRRWHVSLSSWFRDYLYIPLGGSRGGSARTYRNLVIVFLTCGLWHGAAWTFVAWGAYHWAWLVLERSHPRLVPRGPLGHVYALLVVLVGWVFFRAESLTGGLEHLAAMWPLRSPAPLQLEAGPLLQPAVILALAGGVLVASKLPLLGWNALRRWAADHRLLTPIDGLQQLACLGLLLLATAELAAGSYNPFIYFRF